MFSGKIQYLMDLRVWTYVSKHCQTCKNSEDSPNGLCGWLNLGKEIHNFLLLIYNYSGQKTIYKVSMQVHTIKA